jgi:uncharacterized membrane protein
MKNKNDLNISWFNKLHAIHKLLISVLIAFAVYSIFPMQHLNSLAQKMVWWDSFCMSLIILSCITFFTISSEQLCVQSSRQDESRFMIFIVILITTLASLLAVVLLITSKSQLNASKDWELPIAIIGMMCSWILVHTIFTLRYAHLYYDNTQKGEGLDFPGDKDPDYLDFAYYSFVIGMTFQVSDVSIKTKRFRRLTLLHSLLAFAFNTVIVALTINIIAGLGG